MNFLNEAQAYEGEMRAFFEDLHRHPEPSHFETRTNRRVREQLKAHGIDMLCPKDNITIAVIHGAKPGKTVGLRFDTDALQLQELCDVPYKSEHDGLMHGCGHDAHTTCGVYVARLLKAHADELCGAYKIIFQPAEEGEHGADEVIATGLVSDVDAFFGCTSGACIRPARCMPRQAASGPSRICSKSPSTAKAATAQRRNSA